MLCFLSSHQTACCLFSLWVTEVKCWTQTHIHGWLSIITPSCPHITVPHPLQNSLFTIIASQNKSAWEPLFLYKTLTCFQTGDAVVAEAALLLTGWDRMRKVREYRCARIFSAPPQCVRTEGYLSHRLWLEFYVWIKLELELLPHLRPGCNSSQFGP